MLTYELEKIENGLISYLFYPEGRLRPGRVVFSIDGKRLSFEDSPDDGIGWYRGHAFSGIDLSRQSGVVAWY